MKEYINKISKALFISSFVLVGTSLTSCDDFLTMLPTDQLPEENFWQDKGDLENVRAAAYEKLTQSGLTSKILYWGEFRSDNLDLNDASNTTISNLQSAVLQPSNSIFDWAAFYTGINYCNLVIEKGEDMTTPGSEVDPSFTRADYNLTKAEMVALRSLYYFYLVRAYRNIPYVTKSIRTDNEARADYPAAESGASILGECISLCEENIANGPENYGNDEDNKGRFTKKSMHALLADMYLWRAGLLHNFMSKVDHGKVNFSDVIDEEGNYQTEDGTAIDDAYCNTLSTECLQKAVEHADWVINDINKDYQEDITDDPTKYTSDETSQPYPLILNSILGTSFTDNVYGNIFGTQNSRESIFELQYGDGTTTSNSTITSFFTSYSSSSFNTGTMVCSSTLIGSATSDQPETGWGKCDLRLLENCFYKSTDTRKPFIKFVCNGVSAIQNTDYPSGCEVLAHLSDDNTSYTQSGRESSNINTHWPVYRLTDIMLIKAEALARLNTELTEGFQLCNQIFKRNNPVAYYSDYSSYNVSFPRLADNYASGKKASDLLSLVYRERQREFVGEGKRWFDITRAIEFGYSDPTSTEAGKPKDVLPSFISLKSAVSNRLTNLWSFYNPIYSEELKVNGVEYGGKLVQNPVWERYSTN